MSEYINLRFTHEELNNVHKRLNEELGFIISDFNDIWYHSREKVSGRSDISKELLFNGVYNYDSDIDGNSFGYNYALLDTISEYIYELRDSSGYHLQKPESYENSQIYLSEYLSCTDRLREINDTIRDIILPLIKILEVVIDECDYSKLYSDLRYVQTSLNKYSLDNERVRG